MDSAHADDFAHTGACAYHQRTGGYLSKPYLRLIFYADNIARLGVFPQVIKHLISRTLTGITRSPILVKIALSKLARARVWCTRRSEIDHLWLDNANLALFGWRAAHPI
jgi:hypothetical protein